MADKDDDPPSVVPTEHDAEIGRIARSWAHLEFVIDQTTWAVGGMEQQFAACITAQIPSAYGKLSALMAVLGIWGISPELAKEVRSFKGRVDGLMEQRNRVVHDPRMQDHQGRIVRWQITAKGGKQVFGPQLETIDDLKKVRRDIRQAILHFKELSGKMFAEINIKGTANLHRFVDPSPETSSESED